MSGSSAILAIILFISFLGVYAPESLAVDSKQRFEDQKSVQEVVVEQQRLRKFLNEYKIKRSSKYLSQLDDAEDLSRRARSTLADPPSQSGSGMSYYDTSAQGPGPNPFAPPSPPPISPFINGSGLVCCCGDGGRTYETSYQDTAPQGCCCGDRTSCCLSNAGLVTAICAGSQLCGIIMLVAALVGTMILCVCMSGALHSRRRRRQALELQAVQLAANGDINGALRPGPQAICIPDDQLPSLRILPATEPVLAAAAAAEEETTNDANGNAVLAVPPTPPTTTTTEESINQPPTTGLAIHNRSSKECPICLDSIQIHADTWAIFPCSHGCCRPCVGDLLRHSSRRVNETTLAVLCPLCRKIAVASDSEATPVYPGTAATVTVTTMNNNNNDSSHYRDNNNVIAATMTAPDEAFNVPQTHVIEPRENPSAHANTGDVNDNYQNNNNNNNSNARPVDGSPQQEQSRWNPFRARFRRVRRWI